MLTKKNSTGGPGGKSNSLEFLKDLPPVSREVFEDYLQSKEFGVIQKQGIVWKYGNPWLYPAHEHRQLRTLVRVDLLAQLEAVEKTTRTKPPEIPESVRQSKMLREKEWHMNKAKLNGPRPTNNL